MARAAWSAPVAVSMTTAVAMLGCRSCLAQPEQCVYLRTRKSRRDDGIHVKGAMASMMSERWNDDGRRSRAGVFHAVPPLARQLSSVPSSSSCSGGSSWVLWQDNTPLSSSMYKKIQRKGRVCSVLLVLAAVFVVVVVLSIAGLAVYMGALRIDPKEYELMLNGSLHIIGDEKINPSLKNASSLLFKEKADHLQSVIEKVYQKSEIRAGLKSCTVEKFDTSHDGSQLIVFFRLHLDRRKLPRSMISIEEAAKSILVREATSPVPVAFKSIHVDKDSIVIKRSMDAVQEFFKNEIAIEKNMTDNGDDNLKVKNGILIKSATKSPETTTIIQTAVTEDTTVKSLSNTEKLSTDLELDENIPVIEGVYIGTNPNYGEKIENVSDYETKKTENLKIENLILHNLKNIEERFDTKDETDLSVSAKRGLVSSHGGSDLSNLDSKSKDHITSKTLSGIPHTHLQETSKQSTMKANVSQNQEVDSTNGDNTSDHLISKRIGDIKLGKFTDGGIITVFEDELSIHPSLIKTTSYNDRYEAINKRLNNKQDLKHEQNIQLRNNQTKSNEQAGKWKVNSEESSNRNRTTVTQIIPHTTEEPWRPVLQSSYDSKNSFVHNIGIDSNPGVLEEKTYLYPIDYAKQDDYKKIQHNEETDLFKYSDSQISDSEEGIKGSAIPVEIIYPPEGAGLLSSSEAGPASVHSHKTTSVWYPYIKEETPEPFVIPDLPLVQEFHNVDTLIKAALPDLNREWIFPPSRSDVSAEDKNNSGKENGQINNFKSDVIGSSVPKNYTENNSQPINDTFQKHSALSDESDVVISINHSDLTETSTQSSPEQNTQFLKENNVPTLLELFSETIPQLDASTEPFTSSHKLTQDSEVHLTPPTTDRINYPVVTLLPVKSYLGRPSHIRPKIPSLHYEEIVDHRNKINSTRTRLNLTDENKLTQISEINSNIEVESTTSRRWQMRPTVQTQGYNRLKLGVSNAVPVTTVASTILHTEVITSTSVQISFREDSSILYNKSKEKTTDFEHISQNNSESTKISKPELNVKMTTILPFKVQNSSSYKVKHTVPSALLSKIRILNQSTDTTQPFVTHRQPKMKLHNLSSSRENESKTLTSDDMAKNHTFNGPSSPETKPTENFGSEASHDTLNFVESTELPPTTPLSIAEMVDVKGRNCSEENSCQRGSIDENTTADPVHVSNTDSVVVHMNYTVSKISAKVNVGKDVEMSILEPLTGVPATDSTVTLLEPITGIEYNRNSEKSFSSTSTNKSVENLIVLNAISKFANVHMNNADKVKENNSGSGKNKTNTVITLQDFDKTHKLQNNVTYNIPLFPMLTKVLNKDPNPSNNMQISRIPSIIQNFKIDSSGNTSACPKNYTLRCGDGECISPMSRCNQLVDCSDGVDEKDCTCADYLRAQFLTRKLCDGIVDCWDFSDENNCEWCSPGQYVCPNSQVCVDQLKLCDGNRDCPYGDDEKLCITISETTSDASNFTYHSHGFLMVRKQGQWGKLCLQSFDSVIERSHATWQITDLGRAVCKAMTYNDFDRVERYTETELQTNSRSNDEHYYELTYSPANYTESSPRSGVSFNITNCPNREVVHVTCRDLECGVRPQAVNQWARIVGGGNAGPGSWPWQAALYKEGEFQCGATLISEHWLISAGHCFYHALDDFWVARLGALRRGTSFPSPFEQQRPISRIILHPNYVDSGFINDISLLRMRDPVSFSDYVRPICLPPANTILKDGRLCTVVGWGQLFEVGRIFPDTLQEVQLPIITTAECRKRTILLPLYRITDNMFCAGFDRGGRDACLGDSGGPLMCQEPDGKWSLYGVTSNGYGCARANRPGVYTKVSNYMTWIKTTMAQSSAIVRETKTFCKGHRCPLGECLPKNRVCNGFMECSDGSDERGCW